MEDDERGEDEEEHRRQRVPRAKLEPEVLAREGDDVGGVEGERAHARTSLWVASAATRAGSCVESTIVRSPVRAASSRVEERRPVLVERRERLVEHEQRRIVEQRPAEREALRHPARERRDAIGPRVPEAEPLEEHPAPLAPLGDAVEPSEEVEVLERRQLAVEQRLVPDEAEVAPFARRPSSMPRVGAARPATSRSRVVLPEPFGAGDDAGTRRRGTANETPRRTRLRP